MKRLLLRAIPLIGVAFFIGCNTTPAAPPPAEPPAATEPAPDSDSEYEPVSSSEQAVYDKYANGLILDGSRTYTVKRGDSLSRIAWRLYNNGYYYPVIKLASGNLIQDIDLILPGMVLTIPDIDRNLNDAQARATIKSFLNEIADIETSRNRHKTASGIRNLANSL